MTQPKAIRSIVMSGGQGDVIMAVLGLIALRSIAPQAIAPGARIYTRSLATEASQALLPDLEVLSMEGMRRPARPRYFTSADTSWSTVIRNWFYPDYYVNFVEHRRWASFGQPSPSMNRRMQTWLNTFKFGPTTDWREETPIYYGIRMWAPLTKAWGIDGLSLYRACLDTFNQAQELLTEWGQQQAICVPLCDVALFPGAGAYQYLPISLVEKLKASLPVDTQYVCYFAPGDELAERYEAAGHPVQITPSVASLMPVLRQSTAVLTPDSFVSHLAQLAAPGHIAVMSHDFPVHTMHPAAPSSRCFEALDCCPCFYYNRPHRSDDNQDHCAAGHRHCQIYDRGTYQQQVINAVLARLKTKAKASLR